MSFLNPGSREASFWNGCVQGFSGEDRQANGHCQLPDIEGQQWHSKFMGNKLGEAAWSCWKSCHQIHKETMVHKAALKVWEEWLWAMCHWYTAHSSHI